MTDWTARELNVIGAAEELDIAPARPDRSLRPYTTIWVVRVGDELYVRSYRGRRGSWFRHALQSHQAASVPQAWNAMWHSKNPTTLTMTRSTRPTAANTPDTPPTSSRWSARTPPQRPCAWPPADPAGLGAVANSPVAVTPSPESH
jgi:Uncharacterized protein conserved in bacteria (DUF2255)